MKTPSQIIDGFEAFRKRRHKSKSEVTGADVRKLQEEYVSDVMREEYWRGYRDGEVFGKASKTATERSHE